MTLVEIVIAIGVVSFVASLSSAILIQVSTVNARMSLQSHMADLRDEFSANLERERNWSATIADTTYNSPLTFACLRNNTDCSPPPAPLPGDPDGYQFTPMIYRDDASIPYAGTPNIATSGYQPTNNPTAGFDPDGGLCDFFSLAPGNTRCPVRIEFFWKPLCAGTGPGQCTDPVVEIAMRFLIRTHVSSGISYISANLYNRTFRKRPLGMSATTIGQCQDPTPIPVGFDASGNPICVKPADVL